VPLTLELILSKSKYGFLLKRYGRFDDLKSTVDRIKAKAYFEKLEGTTFPAFRINIKVHNLLQTFIIGGGFEI